MNFYKYTVGSPRTNGIFCYFFRYSAFKRLDKLKIICYNSQKYAKEELTMRSHFKIKTRFLAAVLCTLLILPAIPAGAKTIEEVQAEQAALQEETNALEDQLAQLQDDEAKAQEYSDTLSEKIIHTKDKIDKTRQNINDLNDNIVELEKKLDESEKEYTDTLEQLKDRIKVLYKAGDVGTIEILMSSTSLYDFSMRSELLKSMTAHDKLLMDKITEYMIKTKAERESLKKQKDEVAALQKDLEADQANLLDMQSENEKIIAELQTNQAAKQEQIAANEAEDEALNAEIANLIAEKKAAEEAAAKAAEEAAKNQGSSGGESGGGSGEGSGGDDNVYVPPNNGGGGGLDAQWPLPGYSANDITQHYGNNGHRGLDIGVPYGSPITACSDGEVLSATYHWSWGYNVLLYHNGTYSTRYAHMSSMAVSAGEYVSRGQVIGYVGNTGNSFGDHLHFEVYLNGDRVDPYPYLTSLS